MKKCGDKGYTKAGVYASEKRAKEVSILLKSKFTCIKVKKGTTGTAWGRPRTVYRVWVK